jgi:hypothetical protein
MNMTALLTYSAFRTKRRGKRRLVHKMRPKTQGTDPILASGEKIDLTGGQPVKRRNADGRTGLSGITRSAT